MRTWLAPGWHARRERDLCCPADAVFPCSCSSQSARRIISISLRDGRALLERARVARLYWRYPILRHTIPRVGASLAPAERPRSVLLRTPAPARDTRTVTIDWGGGEGGRGWGAGGFTCTGRAQHQFPEGFLRVRRQRYPSCESVARHLQPPYNLDSRTRAWPSSHPTVPMGLP